MVRRSGWKTEKKSRYTRWLLIAATLSIASLQNPLWGQCSYRRQNFLRSTDGAVGDRFGVSIAVSGSTLLTGSPLVDRFGFDAGAAFIYRYSNGSWIESQRISASDSFVFDAFGESASIDGAILVVGTPREGDEFPDAGAAYVFRDLNGIFSEEQKLIGRDLRVSDFFGWSVAVSGSRIAVGVPTDDDGFRGSGSVYLFVHDGTAWIEEQKLTASDASRDAWFGGSVSLENEVLVVGAFNESRIARFAGAAYVFRYDGLSWTEEQKIVPPSSLANDHFATTVALSGERIAIGAPAGGESRGGAVTIFRAKLGRWTVEEVILSPTGVVNQKFGSSVALSPQALLVGAPGGLEPSAFLYVRDSTDQLLPGQDLSNNILTRDSEFGASVALGEGLVIVGVPGDDGVANNQGSLVSFATDTDLILAVAGNVNSGFGSVKNVLFLNNSTGSDELRTVEYNVNGSFTLEVKRPPMIPAGETAPFAIYAWLGTPSLASTRSLPFDIGCTAMPTPLSLMNGGGPQPILIWNNASRVRLLGVPNRPSLPAPSVLLHRPAGPRHAAIFFVQGIIFDPGAAGAIPASVTNGITAKPVFMR